MVTPGPLNDSERACCALLFVTAHLTQHHLHILQSLELKPYLRNSGHTLLSAPKTMQSESVVT